MTWPSRAICSPSLSGSTCVRALLAALQAYREKRYADFARLATSHWARHPVVTGESAADRAGMIRTGATSALPSGRRLR